MRTIGSLVFVLMIMGQNLNAQLWQSVGAGLSDMVTALGVDSANSRLFAGGRFFYSDTTYLGQVGFFDGQNWIPMDSGLGCYPFSGGDPGFLLKHDSLLFMGGAHYRCEDWTYFLHSWDGTMWQSQGYTNAPVQLWEVDGELFACGTFDTLGSNPIKRIGKWNGSGWEQFGDTSFLDQVFWAITVNKFQGDYYMGGNFNLGLAPGEIAKWDGSQWSILGGGIKGDSWVERLVVYDSLLWVAGLFDRSAGNAGNHVMTWDGAQWEDPFPNVYFTTQVREMKSYRGELYFAGHHYIYTNGTWQGPRWLAKYDGQEFCSFGGPDIYSVTFTHLDGKFFASAGNVPNYNPYGYCAEWIGGNQMDFCVQQGPLAVEPPFQDAGRLVVFPNPASDVVEVRWEGGQIESIQVQDMLGRQLNVPVWMDGPGSAMLDISSLPSGSYLLKCVSPKGATTTLKFAKQ